MPAHPRVLVVDDDPDITRTFQVILGAEGYDVTTASDGAAAIAVLRQQPVDLMLLDLAMPVADGFDVLRALNDGTARPRRCPGAASADTTAGTVVCSKPMIIVMSGYLDPKRETAARRLGAQFVLTKPPDIGEILRLCSQLTGSRQESA